MNISDMINNIAKGIQGIPEKDIANILEYIENNEWGIAYETLCSVIEQEKLIITREEYDIIKKLGLLMKMDSYYWEDIKNNQA